jgi:hypothetical protein
LPEHLVVGGVGLDHLGQPVRPVLHDPRVGVDADTAEAAVKSAVTTGACPPPARAAGSIINPVAMAIAPRKASGTIRAGYRQRERTTYCEASVSPREQGARMQLTKVTVFASLRGRAALS